MGLDTVLVAAVGTSGVLFSMTGLGMILRPRRLWASWFSLEHRWRVRRFGGGWTHLETALQRRGYFWIPRDIELARPEDVYAYATSDRFWRSWYSWFVRGLIWYAGLLHIFFAFVILGFVLPGLP